MDSKQNDKQPNRSIKIEGNVEQSILVTGSNNIVITILKGIDKETLDKRRSIDYKEKGIAKVQKWGEQMLLHGIWNWHLLGQAIEDYLDSIKYNPEHQHPWTNLAYVYHLIGEKQKARECLEKSFELASPGPNHPGDNYKQVKFAIDNDSYLSEGQVEHPPVPDWFRRKYKKFLR